MGLAEAYLARVVPPELEPLLHTSEGRRALTQDEPLLFALLYLARHLKSPDTGGQITLSQVHLDWCRQAQRWTTRPSAPAEQRDAYIAPRSMGKPVGIDAMVLLESGRSVPLADVRVGDMVITHRGRARRVTAVHEQGVLPTVLIETRSGRSVEAALDHPFLTTRGWVEAGDLTADHVLALVPQAQAGARSDRRLEEFRMAGYIIGDGNVTLNTADGKPNGMNAHITCFDDLETEDIRACAAAIGFTVGSCPPSAPGRYPLTGGAKQWIRDAGLAGFTSHTKHVPDWVFTATEEEIGHFVGAYFSCDGTVTEWRAHQPIAELYSVSRDLLAGVRHLLLRLGIESRLKLKRGAYGRAEHLSYRLTITGKNNIAKFAERVPVYGVKAERLMPLRALRSAFDEVLLPDPVASIERGRSAECRCLTVEEDHTFTVEDLVVHNSTWWFLALPMWAAAHGHSSFVAAMSDSAAQAETHLSTFKHELDTNELLRADYPELCRALSRPRGSTVADNRAMLITAAGFVFAARGIDSSNLGLKVGDKRPDLIILDDVEPDESSYSAAQALKRLGTIRDAVLPLSVYARVVWVGTVTMPGSLVHRLSQLARCPVHGSPEAHHGLHA